MILKRSFIVAIIAILLLITVAAFTQVALDQKQEKNLTLESRLITLEKKVLDLETKLSSLEKQVNNPPVKIIPCK